MRCCRYGQSKTQLKNIREPSGGGGGCSHSNHRNTHKINTQQRGGFTGRTGARGGDPVADTQDSPPATHIPTYIHTHTNESHMMLQSVVGPHVPRPDRWWAISTHRAPRPRAPHVAAHGRATVHVRPAHPRPTPPRWYPLLRLRQQTPAPPLLSWWWLSS